MGWAWDNSDVGMITKVLYDFCLGHPEVTCAKWNLEEFELTCHFEDGPKPVQFNDFAENSDWWQKMVALDEELSKWTLPDVDEFLDD